MYNFIWEGNEMKEESNSYCGIATHKISFELILKQTFIHMMIMMKKSVKRVQNN